VPFDQPPLLCSPLRLVRQSDDRSSMRIYEARKAVVGSIPSKKDFRLDYHDESVEYEC